MISEKKKITCGLANRSCAITIIVLMVTVVFGVGDVGGGQPSDLHTLAFLPGIAHNVDTGEQFITIQGAIDDPQTLNGHTIEVGEGTYIENVVIDKAITLVGEDKETTVIDGDRNSHVVQITVDWVNITGFTITRSSTSTSGIRLSNVQNCLIENNICIDNNNGIYLGSSDNNIIENNNCTLNTIGIRLYMGSDFNTIRNNNFSYNEYGINNDGSSYNTFSNNMMIEDGIFIKGVSLSAWNTHSIDTSNTVNGKPVYYWKNQTGGTIPPGAGQIILANCTNVVVEDQEVSNIYVGIQLGFSSDNTIKNSNLSNNIYGIYFRASSNNDIINNDVSSNSNGIYFYSGSNGNNITGNNLSLNVNGIYIYMGPDWNNITDNTITNNDNGIRIYWNCDSNNITNNTLLNNNNYGIWLDNSDNNIIEDNNCTFGLYGLRIDGSNFNTINRNNISYYDNYGINNEDSSYNTFSDNIMIEDGILIKGNLIEHWNTHLIDTSNIVNGKTVYYWKNQTGGTIPPGAGQIILANCTNVVVEDQEVSNTTVGIQLGFSPSNKINNSLALNSYEGIYIQNSNDNSITNNTVSNNDDGINIVGSFSNNITNNTVSNNNYGFYLAASFNNIITNNTVSDNNNGIYLNTGGSNDFTDNTISNNNNNGIYIYNSDSNDFTDNTVSNNNYGFYLSRSSFNTFSNNIMIEDGIFIRGFSLEDWNTHSIDISNTVNGKPVHYWKNQAGGTIPLNAGQIILANCINVIVEDQDVNNTTAGIQLGYSSNNIINNNMVRNNIEGICLEESNGNSITNNTVNSNNDCGIWLYSDCDSNIITNNTVSNNDDGIYIYWNSDTNSVYHNDIIDNSHQAYDNTGTNFWNAPYPTGGNYWSDYSGVDLNSTPTQDVPPPDGIGDTPYTNIDGGAGAQDNYPLMPPNFLIPVIEGWNFISTPLIGETAIPDALIDEDGDTTWTILQYYDATDPTDHWKTWAEFKPPGLNDLTSIDNKMGVWLYIPTGSLGDGLINVTGYQPLSTIINLKIGWNLVGYPAQNDGTYDINQLMLDCPEVTHVEGFNPSAPYDIEELAGDYVLKRGEGYWVYAEVDCTWDIGW